MKRYRLKKDLPTFNAGDEFELTPCGALVQITNGRTGVCAYSASTLEKFPNILADWFEEIKEPTRWKPERYDEEYYYLENTGWICSDTWRDAVSIDRERFDIGNCFKTEEEAERVAEYLKALATVRGDATSKFVKDKGNWFVGYDTILKSLKPSFNVYEVRNGVFGLPYFATKEDAKRSIEQHKNEWLTIFGFEDSAEEEE